MTYITTYKDLTRIVICGKKEVKNNAMNLGTSLSRYDQDYNTMEYPRITEVPVKIDRKRVINSCD